jgi:hypothetical protein
MPANPQLEILGSIVIAPIVFVMNGLMGFRPSPSNLFHDIAVFKHSPTVRCLNSYVTIHLRLASALKVGMPPSAHCCIATGKRTKSPSVVMVCWRNPLAVFTPNPGSPSARARAKSRPRNLFFVKEPARPFLNDLFGIGWNVYLHVSNSTKPTILVCRYLYLTNHNLKILLLP